MKFFWSLLCVVASGAAALGCSGADAATADSANGDVSETPVAQTKSGELTVALYARTTDNLVRGNNRVELEVESAEAQQMPDFEVELMTYMPAMGHGPSQQPKLVEMEGNRYTFDDVVLNMPGLWELHVQFSGDLREELVFEFDVE